MIFKIRIRQGRVAGFVLAVDISSSAIRQQQPNDVYVPFVGGCVQWRSIAVGGLVHVRVFVQQQPRRVDVALLAGNKQLRPTLLVRLVNIGAAVQPLLHDADVSLLRPVRASLSLLVCNYL